MEDFPQHYLKRFMSNTSEVLIIVTTILSFKRYNMCRTNHTHSNITIIMNLIRKERDKRNSLKYNILYDGNVLSQ